MKTGDDPKGFSLIVFNRNGAKVFETSNVEVGWNGMIGGNSAPTGTYVYVLQATTSEGVLVRKQGTLLLIR
ncbi:gliding motility-associated C-terminal domain-containing protein [Puia sp. P3]|uniref:T9SS type B sorting domain-containing protein n=1 Tax=Puia sp. P3 TaxID=3423952 RepID=UPI003D664800